MSSLLYQHFLVSRVLLAVCVTQTKLLLDQHLIHSLTETSNLNPQPVLHWEKLGPSAKKKTPKDLCIFILNTTFFWPIYQRPDRPTRSARRITLKAKVGKMTAACENWHTRLFKLGPGEPEHKITSIPFALRRAVGECDQQQHNNGEAGRGEGRSY